MQQQIEELQGLLLKQELLHLIISASLCQHCILYTNIDHWWKIKGDTVLSINTCSLHHLCSRHYLLCAALVIRLQNNHALQCLEINDPAH